MPELAPSATLAVLVLAGIGAILWAARRERRRSEQALRQSRELLAERAATEDALRRERAGLRTLINTIPDLVWLKDPDGAFLAANPMFERLMGAPEKDLLGKTDYDFLDVALADFFREQDRKAVASGKPTINEEWGTFPDDGRRALFETVKTPMLDEQGRLLGVLGIARDITERRRAEYLLQTTDSLLERTSSLAKIGGWEFEAATGEGTWTAEVARILDLDSEQTPTVELGLSYFHGAAHEAMAKAVREAIELGKPYDIELEMVSGKGVRKSVRAVGDPIREGGRVVRVQGVFQDVTTRKEAEETLRQSEERFRQLAENIQEVFWMTDPATSEMLYLSPAYERIWGRSLESVRIDPGEWLNAIHVDDRERVLQAAASRQTEGTYDERYRIVRPDGSERWIHDRAFPVRDAGGAVYRVVGVAEDVTASVAAEQERHDLQEQLRQSQKMEAVGRLAGGVAHDFNNMLTIILGCAELAVAQSGQSEPLAKQLRGIQGAAQRSADLTRQLLAFSRQQTIAPRAIDLNAQMRSMERLLRRLIGEDVDLLFVLAADLWAVRMDPTQVDQILANLTVNARDAMPDGGRLTVETRNVTMDESAARRHGITPPGDYVMLAVSDTGTGMDKATQERVFEPFFTTKPEGKGTGLGLSTVYGIVKQNDGFINVYSEPREGTTIKVYVSRHAGEPENTKNTEAVSGADTAGQGTILLVEDEDDLREVAKELLEGLGYTVLDAANAAVALAICGAPEPRIDLLLTDVVMPAMNGRDLADRVRVLRPGIRTLFASGYTADTIAHRGVLDAGIHFIEKPFTIDTLARKVREALASA